MSADRSAELCWGQRYIWLRHAQLPAEARHDTHIVCSYDMPDGATLPMLRTTINYLVRRHEALRTTYHFDADTDPRQQVHPPAPLPLVAASVERDGTPTPAEVIEELSTTPFELAKEWPIRACAITVGGQPRQLILVLNHIAFDAWTIDRFERELVALREGIGAGRSAALDPVRHQPLDLARYEASSEAKARTRETMSFWRREIAELPTDVFAARRTRAVGPPAFGATLTSPSMLDASRRIADRERVWPSLVHVATYTAMMAAYTGAGHVPHLSFSGNRGIADYGDVMTCMFSPVLTNVDCSDDPPFSVLVSRVARRFESAVDNAYLPYDELLELLAVESFRRSRPLRTGSELNFLSHASHSSRARRTKFAWNATPAAWAEYGADSYFRIYQLSDAVTVGLNVRSSVMGGADVERFLRGYEDVLLAHLDPGTDLTIAEIAARTGFSAPGPVACPSTTDQPDVDQEASRVLDIVVRKANHLPELDAANCYAGAGGRVLRIPRVLSLLADHGWGGLSVYDLADGVPLRSVAGKLRRIT